MNIPQFINEDLLQNFGAVSIQQIRKRFEDGTFYLETAKDIFATIKRRNKIVYTNIYNAVRIIGEAFLLLNGYRAKIKDHHKTVIAISKLLMNDPVMDLVFSRFDKMRKVRNAIDYDVETPDISDVNIEQAIKDTTILADKVLGAINKRDNRQKLL